MVQVVPLGRAGQRRGVRGIASCRAPVTHGKLGHPMTASSTRRGLLRLVATQLAGGESGWMDESAPRLPVAPPTSRCATADDLRALAAEVGLAHRISAAVQVARGS